MTQKPLNEMADFGYDKMSEGDGYNLHLLYMLARDVQNLKDSGCSKEEFLSVIHAFESQFAALQSSIPRALESSFASKSEVSSIWKSSESVFATKKSLSELAQAFTDHVQNYPDKLELLNALNEVISSQDQHKTYFSSKTIAPAEVLQLNANPIVLVGAPGDGKFVEFISVEFFMDYETAVYTGVGAGNDLSVYFETAGEIMQVETTGFLDQASDQRRFARTSYSLPVPLNESVYLKMLTGEVASGDSPLKVLTTYRIIEAII